MFWVGEQEPKQRDHSKPRQASPEPPATSPPPDESDLELLQEKQNLEEQLARLQAKLNKAKEGKVKAERSISRSDPPAPSSRRASPAPSTSAKRAPSQAPSRTPSQDPSGKRSSSEGPKPSSRMVRQNAFVDLANRRPVAAPSRARTLPPRVEEIQEDDRDAEEDEELDQEAMEEEEEEEETQERKTSGRTQVLNSGKYGTIHDSKTGQDFWLVLTYTWCRFTFPLTHRRYRLVQVCFCVNTYVSGLYLRCFLNVLSNSEYGEPGTAGKKKQKL